MRLIRQIILTLLINVFAVAVTASIIPGITYDYGLQGLLTISIVLGAVNILIKPILKLLSLPIEIATIGICTVAINTAMLLIVDHLLPEFQIIGFAFPGLSLNSFIIPPFMLPAWGTALLASIVIGLITSFLYWLTKSK